ncbi:M36 family metallopeptidase [Streptosporangium sp. NPDC051023]|uniref:M36 family metallopeptidase n=1 Tax=Streptosporangium sp. NPDC051023 TaxID=3155410 RepID=UPI00344D9135
MLTRIRLRAAAAAAAAAVGVATLVLPLATTAGVAQGSEAAKGASGAKTSAILRSPAKGHGKPDLDNRQGRVPPPSGLSARSAGPGAEVRWNALGTPAVVTGSAPLAEHLGTDPVQAARAYLKSHEDLFGLSAAEVDALERIGVNPIGPGHAVLLRQRFGGLPSGVDGLVAVAVADGKVEYVASSLSRDTAAPPAAVIGEKQAVEIAARDGGVDLAAVTTKRVTPVAVPAPDGVHRAYQVILIATAQGGVPAGYTTHVDAVSGEVLVRDNLVDGIADADPGNPSWTVFPANPPSDYSSADTRQRWCFAAGPGCDLVTGGDPATGQAWDVDPATNTPTRTSSGNAARTYEKRDRYEVELPGTRGNAPSPSRDYAYPWKNTWNASKCDPATLTRPGEADLETSIAHLHVGINRMHDWSYRLGFTETAWNMQADNRGRGGLGNDAAIGSAQVGALIGVRHFGGQVNTPDGIPPGTFTALSMPQAGSSYGPCVDTSYDLTLIGHEYSHAITSRMIGGPDGGWISWQGGMLAESTSDLFAMEYLYEYGLRPSGDTPYVIGGYLTGAAERGVRNYDMSKSPLNYSDIGYDRTEPQTHEDGEIWAATQFDVREAFLKRYGNGTLAQQRACADGRRPVERCPGNRRWAQLTFDALLLTTGAGSLADERDALLAADRVRFGGANQDIIWRAFAGRGLGEGADGDNGNDFNPTPSFANPKGDNGFLHLTSDGAAEGAVLRLYVGDYEARVVPVADTDPATPLGDTVEMTPGAYRLLLVGGGYGHTRLTSVVSAGRTNPIRVPPSRNLASAADGATASGDGVNQAKLIDETEATNWASLTGPPIGKSVVVDLAGDRPVTVRRVQVSAMIRDDYRDEVDPSQTPFSSLRSFEVLACRADCADTANFHSIYTSRPDAFPSVRPWPIAPHMTIRSFRVPATDATHLMLRVLGSQCTGNPLYAGEQENDPDSATDCATAGYKPDEVRAAEFQAFSH